ncbi:MAG: hypothetical protein K2J80_07065, partial [Oscillospiraceae bacterium]|nr:hypothetical protein [Oscillospiraceae bacterium]
LCAFADSAGFAAESETTVTAQTPFDKKYVSIDWNTSAAESVGVPIAYGEYLLVPTQNKVNKLSEKDGKTVASVGFDEKVSENHKGAVTDGVLIQPTRTSIYAIDVGNMSVLCSRTFGEIVTDVAAADGLVYFGYMDDAKYRFCCADRSNDLETVWEYASDEPVTSPARLGNNVMFGADSKLIVKTESGFEENEVGAEITHVFAGKYAVFMCCKNGELRKLRLDEDGKAEDDSLEICELGGELTVPAGIDNHIYVGSTEGFFVVDGLNMEITEKFDNLKNAAAPIMTIGSGVRAYTAAPHSDPNGERWYLYSVLDSDESLSLSELAKIIDFTNGKIAVSNSGRMFFRDARGQVWAISGNKPSVIVGVIKVVLVFAIFIMVLLILRTWAKKRREKRPPEY